MKASYGQPKLQISFGVAIARGYWVPRLYVHLLLTSWPRFHLGKCKFSFLTENVLIKYKRVAKLGKFTSQRLDALSSMLFYITSLTMDQTFDYQIYIKTWGQRRNSVNPG